MDDASVPDLNQTSKIGTYVCENCGKEFTRYRSTQDRHKHAYCSAGCSPNASTSKTSLRRICHTCGKPIQRIRSSIHPSNAVFCSIPCYRIYRRGMPIHEKSRIEKKCASCGKFFWVPPSREQTAHYCSYACANAGHRNPTTPGICACGCGTPLPEKQRGGGTVFDGVLCRFVQGHGKRIPPEHLAWYLLDRSEMVGDCRLWKGVPTTSYPQIRIRGGSKKLTHVVWELQKGPVPPGKDLCHHCDTPSCIRLEHLFLGTDVDNSADAVKKGRHAHGATHGRHQVTEADVLEIRRLSAEGMTNVALSERFSVSSTQISHIVTRKHWKHI
jgi:HNH endonuclease